VALRAHAARGNGPKAKAENNRNERKPAAPFTTLYSRFKRVIHTDRDREAVPFR